jgi:transcriptional regulator with XRE-family HTH domain
MIIRQKSEGYDGSHRLVAYERDDNGGLREESRASDLDDQISTFYEQRALEMMRLRRQVMEGEISPIALCMTYQQLTLSDLAARAKLSKRVVKRHLTMDGFRDVTVATLQRYARIFDVAVADFFQFVDVPAEVDVREDRKAERLLQVLTLVVDAARSEGGHEGD